MKQINKTLLGARNDDLRTKINEANFLEDLEVKGLTPETVISEVKDTLGIDANGSVIAEYQDKAAVINRLQKAFIDVSSLTKRLSDDNLIEEAELKSLNDIEGRLAEKVAKVYGLELEDMYLEEENE